MALDFASSPWLQSTANIPAYNSYTISFWYQTDAAVSGNYDTAVALEDTSGNVHLLQTGRSGSGNLYSWVESGGNNSTTGFLPSTGDNWYFVAIAGGTISVTQYWAAEGATSLSSDTANQQSSFTPSRINIGDDETYSPELLDGRIFNLKVWDTALSAAELLTEMYSVRPVLTDNLNRWCPFIEVGDYSDWTSNGGDFSLQTGSITKSTNDNPGIGWGRTASGLYVPASATGGGTGVSATTDALVLTKYNTTVNAETSITSGVDALALTANTASVNAETSIDATLDALTLTENSAGVNAETSITTTVDALTLATNAATVNAETSITATTDALTLAAYAASLSESVNVSATVDALTLTANQATVNAETSITATVDALTLTEYSATVNAETSIAAGVDALTLAEYSATVQVAGSEAADEWFNGTWWQSPFWGTSWWGAGVSAIDVAATTDALTLTANAATVNAETNLAATLDALTLTEHNASVNISDNVTANVDALTLTEYNLSVNAETSITANVDTISLTAYNALVSTGPSISVSVDALTLTEYSVAINAETSLTATSDALTLTEYAATVGTGVEVTASSDSLTLTEYAVTVDVAYNIQATADILSLAEYRASIDTGASGGGYKYNALMSQSFATSFNEGAVKTVTLNWAAILGSDTISTSGWLTYDSMLVIDNSASTLTKSSIKVSARAPGTYKAKNTITTASGDVLVRSFTFWFKETYSNGFKKTDYG